MIKRLMALAVLAVTCMNAQASLQPYYPVPKTVDEATYVSVNVGPYFRNVQSSTPLGTVFSVVADTETWHQSNSGYQAGLTAGWQIIPHFSVESTWTWYENQRVSVATANSDKGSYLNNYYQLKAWSLEAAAVGQYHVMRDTDLFVKLGVAYLQSELNSSLYDTGDSAAVSGHKRYGYWAPMLGAGVRFFFSENWYGLFQYSIYTSGSSDATDSSYTSSGNDVTKYTKLKLPLTQRLGLSVGYLIEL